MPTERVACQHVKDGSADPLLTVAVGGTPVTQCSECLMRLDRLIHTSLVSRNADPSQGHGNNPPGGLLGLAPHAAPPVILNEQPDAVPPTGE